GMHEGGAVVLEVATCARNRAAADLPPLFVDFLGELVDAELMDQDLDARLVDVVAAAVLVVDAHDRLAIAQDVTAVHELLDGLGNEGRAAETAADQHLEAEFALVVLVEPKADVVDLD